MILPRKFLRATHLIKTMHHTLCARQNLCAHLVVLLYFHPIRVFGKIWSEEQRIISLRNTLMRAACLRQIAGSGDLEHLTLEWSLIIQKYSHLISVNSFASEVWYETASTDMEKWILAASRHFVTYPMRDPYFDKIRALYCWQPQMIPLALS